MNPAALFLALGVYGRAPDPDFDPGDMEPILTLLLIAAVAFVGWEIWFLYPRH